MSKQTARIYTSKGKQISVFFPKIIADVRHHRKGNAVNQHCISIVIG